MQSNTFYHVYNHANGSENLFRSDENYRYFLQQWAKYIAPVADTYAYCLMPNHLHFLIKTKNEEEVLEFVHLKKPTLTLQGVDDAKDLTGFENLSGLWLPKQFSNLFNAYAKAYNKQYDRKGSLFMRPFKRIEIDTEQYLTAIVNYIHRNPVKHGFCKEIEDWTHSSYHAYLLDKPSRLQREYILSWFNGKKEFINYHKEHKMIPDQSLYIDY